MPRASKQQARYAVGRCLMLWSSNDVTQQGSRPKTKLDILESAMPFLPSERKALLAVKGIGPTVVARLEQMGYESLAHLSKANTLDIVSKASSIVGSTCWKNSPQARAAIQSAIALAQSHQAQMSNISSQPTACGGG